MRLHGQQPLCIAPGSSLSSASLTHETSIVVDVIPVASSRNVKGSFRTVLGSLSALSLQSTSWRNHVHVQDHSFSIVLCPISVGKLDELDGVGLDVDGKVGEMAGGVQDGLEEDEEADKLVKVDVVIQRKNGGQSESSEYCDGVPENQSQH